MNDSQVVSAKEVKAHDKAQETNELGARSATWS